MFFRNIEIINSCPHLKLTPLSKFKCSLILSFSQRQNSVIRKQIALKRLYNRKVHKLHDFFTKSFQLHSNFMKMYMNQLHVESCITKQNPGKNIYGRYPYRLLSVSVKTIIIFSELGTEIFLLRMPSERNSLLDKNYIYFHLLALKRKKCQLNMNLFSRTVF